MRLKKRSIISFNRRYDDLTLSVASKVFSALDTAVADEARANLFVNHEKLLAMDVNPRQYTDCELFRRDYLAVECLSKFPYLDVKIDKQAVAVEKFLAAEAQCLQTNQRLSGKVPGSLRTTLSCESILWTARNKIFRLLGDLNWDECEQYFGFGPGATTSLRRSKGDPFFKIGAHKPHVTEACSVLAYAAIRRVPGWFTYLCSFEGKSPSSVLEMPVDNQIDMLFTIRDGNRVTTVPKNAKTDRVIAIEPDLNMFIQKGLGGVIRSRLRKVGVDLNDQTRNQILAKEGSISGTLSTIDLSSASDTVAMSLVEELLPPSWVDGIKQCRSSTGVLPSGERISYQKVSSMGNGFTFELESLIFWALCSAVIDIVKPRDRRYAIYGDDIIVSTECTHTLLWMLDFCGFTPNRKKTFVEGPFRESCGKHYFLGTDVTPFYFRDEVRSVDRFFWLANRIREWSSTHIFGCDPLLREVYGMVLSRIPAEFRKPAIPKGLGDLAIIGDFDECRPPFDLRTQSFLAIGVGVKQPTFSPSTYPFLLRNLMRMQTREDRLIISLRMFAMYQAKHLGKGGVAGVAKYNSGNIPVLVKVPVAQWDGFGPWLV